MFSKAATHKRSHIAAKMLVDGIKAQKLAIGEKLPPERIIAEEMGLSRNTIREAIANLQVMGILETRHSQGNFVANTVDENNYEMLLSLIFKNDESPFALLDARIAFEPGAALVASRMSTHNDVQSLITRARRIREALVSGDMETYRNEDLSFHLSIAQISRNSQIINTISSLLKGMKNPLWQAMKSALTDEKLIEARISEHELIAQSFANRNEPEIIDAVRTHLENSKKRFIVDEEANGTLTAKDKVIHQTLS